MILLDHLPKCLKLFAAEAVCISSICLQSAHPFLCNNEKCKCKVSHQKCKVIRWNAVMEYLNRYQQHEVKSMKELLNRMDKIYENVLSKIRKEKCLFEEYFERVRYGQSYKQVKFYIEQHQYCKLTSKSISEAIQVLTEQIPHHKHDSTRFCSVTLKQCQQIDQLMLNMLSYIQQLYKSKLNFTQSLTPPTNTTLHQIRHSSMSLQHEPKQHPPLNHKQQQSHSHSKKSFHQHKSTSSSANKQSVNQTILNKSSFMLNNRVDLTFPKKIDSHIINQATFLNQLINRKVKSYKLLYRASQNNFQLMPFYQKYSQELEKVNKNQLFLTIMLFKTQFTSVLGGFTSLSWEKSLNSSISSDSEQEETSINCKNKKNGKYKLDVQGTTFLFSVNHREQYILTDPLHAIYCSKNSLGFGKKDLRILNKANLKRKSYCCFPVSYNNKMKEYLPQKESSMHLTGNKYSQYFQLEEWEVFRVNLI